MQKIVVDLPEKNRQNAKWLLGGCFMVGLIFFFCVPTAKNIGEALLMVGVLFLLFFSWLRNRTEIYGSCAVATGFLRKNRFYISEITSTERAGKGGFRFIARGPAKNWLCEASTHFEHYDEFERILHNPRTRYAVEEQAPDYKKRVRVIGALRILFLLSGFLVIMALVFEEYLRKFLILWGVIGILAASCVQIYRVEDRNAIMEEGREISATLCAYLDVKFGKGYPVFTFDLNNKEHMVMGMEKCREETDRIGTQKRILYAPGKSAFVMMKEIS